MKSRAAKILRSFGRQLFLRSLITEIRGLREEQKRQNEILLRLAEEFAPAANVVEQPDETPGEIDHLNPAEMAVVYEFAKRFKDQHGIEPTDNDLLTFLAEDATRKTVLEVNRRATEEWETRRGTRVRSV